MKREPKKLKLHRQTIRSLDAAQLKQVVGGHALSFKEGTCAISPMCVVTQDLNDCSQFITTTR